MKSNDYNTSFRLSVLVISFQYKTCNPTISSHVSDRNWMRHGSIQHVKNINNKSSCEIASGEVSMLSNEKLHLIIVITFEIVFWGSEENVELIL